MSHQIFVTCVLIILFSCKSKKDTLKHETGIALLTYNSERNYLNKTLRDYSNLSNIGKYYLKQDSILEAKALFLEDIFKREHKISIQDQINFINLFQTSLKDNNGLVDSVMIDYLKNTPIAKLSDIDQLVLFIKRSFVSKLVANRYYPFDMVGTMATVGSWGIKNGEEFQLQMNITAASSKDPAEWYLMKGEGLGLTKENITDTLHPDAFGRVNITTRKYHTGRNQIYVCTKFKSVHGEEILSKVIEYTVY